MKYTLLLAILVATVGPLSAQQIVAATPIRTAAVCFKSGEQVSGMNKICYYNCLGSQAAITIGAVELCPLSINR